MNRIEIPVHFDLWMRGARFGVITRTTRAGVWLVRMDHPQVRRLVRIAPADQAFCKVL